MLLDLSIHELNKGLDEKKFSSVELIEEAFSRIEQLNPVLNALITVREKEQVLQEARRADATRTEKTSVLHGLPFVLKDSYVTQGIQTTAASTILKDFIAPYNATVYQKLLNAGAILIGKANMDAWGHGASSENTDFGPVKNPWDTTRVPGGSTGGCAVAIAVRMCAFAIGEDTGGSIRNPSAWCNTSGLKVTYGRVSRYGCIAYASSFDTVGPMGKTAEDCAMVLEVIAGKDPYDATSSPHAVLAYGSAIQKPRPLVVGLPHEALGEGVDAEIVKGVKTTAALLEREGYTIKEISMPMLSYGVAVYYQIAPSETSSNLARYDGVRYGQGRDQFTDETKRRIMIGTYALSTGYADKFYHNALKARTLFIEAYKKAFESCDVLLMPVMPFHAPKLGELIADPLKNALTDALTTTQNPVGIPSLAVPIGFSSSGLPMGAQVVGPMFFEEKILSVGYRIQQLTEFHKKKPAL